MSTNLIINADDFGMSSVFNAVILNLIDTGKVSSTTFMVKRYTTNQDKQIKQLLKLAKEKNISIGLHVEIRGKDPKQQLLAQFEKFKEIIGKPPSHIDLHKSSQDKNTILVIEKFCIQNNLAARNFGNPSKNLKTTKVKYFNGSKSTLSEIKTWISSLEGSNYYEILFHPGKFDPTSTSSMNKEREEDVKKILELTTLIKKHNIKLANFSDIKQKTI